MAAWRRRALAAFPELRGELNPAHGRGPYGYNYYSLLFDLFALFRRALSADDEATLSRVFEFAEWCFRQGRRAPDLCNAVCVVFYEHVFDVARRDWPDVAARLSPDVVKACRPLWECRLTGDGVEKLREAIEAAKRTR